MRQHWHRGVAVIIGLALMVASCSDDTDTAPATTTSPPASTSSSTTTVAVATTAPATITTITTTTTIVPSLTAAELCAAALTTPRAIVASETLAEISGIAASRQHEGVIWAHNDSGGLAQIHAIAADGADLGSWALSDAIAFDWEDISLATTAEGEPALVIADFGDNFRVRTDIRMYQVTEPPDLSSPAPLAIETFVLRYPDGAHDAESFFVDPLTGDLVVITKGWDGEATAIYTAPASAIGAGLTEMEHVGDVNVAGADPLPLTTAADISADGTVIAVRTYLSVLLWDRAPGESIADALARPGCNASVELEAQGEAIALLPNGRGYVTLSEGLNPLVNSFEVME